jgi:hypothetical protein
MKMQIGKSGRAVAVAVAVAGKVKEEILDTN